MPAGPSERDRTRALGPAPRRRVANPSGRARLASLVVLLSMLFPPAAHSQGGYLYWLSQGLELLESRRFDAALTLMDEAIAADGSAQFHLLRGVALNRLQRAPEALLSLREAEVRGLDLPRLDFEIGMAAVHLRSFELAAQRLHRYEKARPGETRTALLLGRAHLGLGQLDAAQQWFETTRAREPAMEAHVLDGLARVQAARGDLHAAQAHQRALAARAPGSPLATALARDLEPASGAARWIVSASATAGYNDNVLLTPDGPALPTDVTDADSMFWALSANVGYRFAITPADALIPSYALQAGLYNDVGSANYLTNRVGLTHEHRFSPRLQSSLSVSGQDTRVDDRGFSAGLGLDASLTHRTTPWLVLSAGYGVAATDYDDDPALGAAVRDARRHALFATAYLELPRVMGSRPLLQASVNYAHNAANGSDHDHDAIGLDLGLSVALPWRVMLEASASFARSEYDNPNSVAASATVPTFAFARDDRRSAYRVQLSRSVRDALVAFVAFERVRNESSIESFDYTQNIWSAGLSARF